MAVDEESVSTLPEGDVSDSGSDLPGVPPQRVESRGVNYPTSPAGRSPEGAAVSAQPSSIEQVEIFAEAMTGVWEAIVAELRGTVPDVREVARQLAHHGWCDLFIGLVQVTVKFNTALDKIPERGKQLVKDAIRKSSMQKYRSVVTDVVIDIMVDKVWAAFKGAAVAQVPLLSLLTGDDAIRSLRILAVFSCPAPEGHDEVREHALKPLADDPRGILAAQTRELLAKLFKEWTVEAVT
ncbi:hypothetical protein [Amycolatopsis sacchari]|nr:hypothetical protein [Amycolatopsis sacchari]